MLPIPFDDIGPDDILRLIEDKISERKILEFKQALDIGPDNERAEFLADVSSFANASGGERLRGWKAGRIARAVAGDGPMGPQRPEILFHFISIAALMAGHNRREIHSPREAAAGRPGPTPPSDWQDRGPDEARLRRENSDHGLDRGLK
jgi:hypothetical protein